MRVPGALPPTAPIEWWTRVASGAVPGYRIIGTHGFNNAVGNSPESIWAPGGPYSGFLTVAATLEAISTSANDTAAGSGAREITIDGLDANFNEISEAVAMNGTVVTAATASSFIRVLRVTVTKSGTYGAANEGNISIRVSGGGALVDEISVVSGVGRGRSAHAFYCVPAGKSALLLSYQISLDTLQALTLFLRARPGADIVAAPFSPPRIIKAHHQIVSNVQRDQPIPITFWDDVFPEKTDIYWDAVVNAGSGNVSINMKLLVFDKQ